MSRAVTTPAQPRRSNLKRLLLLVVVLLIVAVAVNFGTIMQVARGERTLKGVIYGMAHGGEEELANFQVPPDMGAEDALVTVEVFLRGGDPCHVPTVLLGEALGGIDPERIRIAFRDTGTQEGLDRFTEIRLGCDQGFAVNGETKFEVVGTDESGEERERTLYLTFDGGWGMPDLHAIFDDALKEAYEGAGMKMGVDEFAQIVDEGRDRALERHKQEANAKEGQER